MPDYFKPWEVNTRRTATEDASRVARGRTVAGTAAVEDPMVDFDFQSFFDELMAQYASELSTTASAPSPDTGYSLGSPLSSEGGASQAGKTSLGTGPGIGYEYEFGFEDVAKKGLSTAVKEGIKDLLGGNVNLGADIIGMGSAPISKAKGAFGKPSMISTVAELALGLGGGMVAGAPGAIIGGIGGRLVGTGLGDLFDIRSREKLRDFVEDEFGWLQAQPAMSGTRRVKTSHGTEAIDWGEAFETQAGMESAWADPDFVEKTLSDFAGETEKVGDFSRLGTQPAKEESIFGGIFDKEPLGAQAQFSYDLLSYRDKAKTLGIHTAGMTPSEVKENIRQREYTFDKRGIDLFAESDTAFDFEEALGGIKDLSQAIDDLLGGGADMGQAGMGGGRGGETETTGAGRGGRGGV